MNRSSMKLYTSTGTRKTIEEARELNVGLMMCNHWYNPDNWSYFAIDNGAYSAYARGVEWESSAFLRICDKAKRLGFKPDFIVIPDKVAGGKESAAISKRWIPILNSTYPGWPLYFVVQDGMEYEDIPEGIDGIFVGGTMEWKLETMHEWAKYAHMHGIKCHVGRIGPVRRMLLAELAGADSIDSTTWVQRKGAFRKYIEGYYNAEAKSCVRAPKLEKVLEVMDEIDGLADIREMQRTAERECHR